MSAGPVPVLLMVRELGIGGCERDVVKLAKAIDRSKFTPHVGCFVSQGLRYEELRATGTPIIEFPVRSFMSPSVVRGANVLSHYVREHQIKVIHCFDVPTVLFGVPVARLNHMPAVIAAQLGERELYKTWMHWSLRATDRIADVVVANSKFIQQSLVSREHIPADRTYLCYNGVDTSIFYPSADPKPPEVAAAPLVIGTVCALRPEKRLDLLFKAFANVRHLVPGMKLLVVGSGSEKQLTETWRTELGLTEDCVLIPAQSDVAPWLRALDIFVISSETESFPNGLLEAMACGCAVIGSRAGGIPELITHHSSGLLFESKNLDDLTAALTKLILDTTLRQSLAKQATVVAREQFSMEINARRNEALYLKLLALKAAKARPAAPEKTGSHTTKPAKHKDG